MIIHFNEGDVCVEETIKNTFEAVCVPYEKGDCVGYGSTMMEAIADLNEKLKERE